MKTTARMLLIFVDDCIGKQHAGRLSLVAAASATNATGFAATAAATTDPDS